jgi:hypothetical protein
LRFQHIRTPAGRARRGGIIMGFRTLCDPLPGSNSFVTLDTGGVGALRLNHRLMAAIHSGSRSVLTRSNP